MFIDFVEKIMKDDEIFYNIKQFHTESGSGRELIIFNLFLCVVNKLDETHVIKPLFLATLQR